MKNKLPPFSAIIFDMDGLVLDTEATYFIAWQKAAKEMNHTLDQSFCLSLSGLHFQDIEKRLQEHFGKHFSLKQFMSLSGKYWQHDVNQHGIPVKQGFFELLDRLKEKKIPFCLATNSAKKNALECLALANLETTFSTIVTRDDVKQGKPRPDIFIAAAKALNTDMTQCLVLEDSVTGIQAANNAKAPCVYIPSVLPANQTTLQSADLTFNNLEELAQIIH